MTPAPRQPDGSCSVCALHSCDGINHGQITFHARVRRGLKRINPQAQIYAAGMGTTQLEPEKPFERSAMTPIGTLMFFTLAVGQAIAMAILKADVFAAGFAVGMGMLGSWLVLRVWSLDQQNTSLKVRLMMLGEKP